MKWPATLILADGRDLRTTALEGDERDAPVAETLVLVPEPVKSEPLRPTPVFDTLEFLDYEDEPGDSEIIPFEPESPPVPPFLSRRFEIGIEPAKPRQRRHFPRQRPMPFPKSPLLC